MTAMTAASAETPKQIRMPRFDLSQSDEVIWSWEANISPSKDRSKGTKQQVKLIKCRFCQKI